MAVVNTSKLRNQQFGKESSNKAHLFQALQNLGDVLTKHTSSMYKTVGTPMVLVLKRCFESPLLRGKVPLRSLQSFQYAVESLLQRT